MVGGFATRHGTFTAYDLIIARNEGASVHALFLAALREWLKQHDENPDATTSRANTFDGGAEVVDI